MQISRMKLPIAAALTGLIVLAAPSAKAIGPGPVHAAADNTAVEAVEVGFFKKKHRSRRFGRHRGHSRKFFHNRFGHRQHLRGKRLHRRHHHQRFRGHHRRPLVGPKLFFKFGPLVITK